jgi:hypothetical protein
MESRLDGRRRHVEGWLSEALEGERANLFGREASLQCRIDAQTEQSAATPQPRLSGRSHIGRESGECQSRSLASGCTRGLRMLMRRIRRSAQITGRSLHRKGQGGFTKRTVNSLAIAAIVFAGLLAFGVRPAEAEWKPTRNVEIIVPAGIGGGAGQMAQLIPGIVQKHHLLPVSMVVISKKGGSGAEGFLYVERQRRPPQADHHFVKSVYDPARDRFALLLQGLHAGRHDGARRVRALGE